MRPDMELLSRRSLSPISNRLSDEKRATPYNSVRETRAAARFQGIVRVARIRSKGNRDRSSLLLCSRKSLHGLGEQKISRRHTAYCHDVHVHPGRRLTRLTFGQRRNIDARYRSPLHFLELWSITSRLILPGLAPRLPSLGCRGQG